MRIGVDARLLSQPVTGIGRYTIELSLALLQEGAELVLYAPEPVSVGDWSVLNAQLRESHMRGRIARMLWSQTVLPYQASRDGLDVFWGSTHRLPRYLPVSLARVVTIHDLVWKFAGETMRPLSRFIEQRLMPQAIDLADYVLTDSYSTERDLKAVFPHIQGKVRTVHLGSNALCEPQPLESLKALGIQYPYFLFVGTLEPRKNLRRLLNGYARLPLSVRSGFQLVIAGGKGWGGVSAEQLLQEFGLTASEVCITGYVSDEQLSTLYAHARFLAMPSLYEGFGFPLIESMSFGVPVLTSKTSSLPEVAGNAGVLVDPLDEQDIANGILKLLCDEHLYNTLAGNSKGNAERFSWRKAARETLAVFDEAIQVRKDKLKVKNTK